LITIIGHIAVEVIMKRANGNKNFIDLTSLQDSGKVSHEYAMNHVEKEYNNLLLQFSYTFKM